MGLESLDLYSQCHLLRIEIKKSELALEHREPNKIFLIRMQAKANSAEMT